MQSTDLGPGLCSEFYFQSPYAIRSGPKVPRCHFVCSGASSDSTERDLETLFIVKSVAEEFPLSGV